jgi:hypothetical protein
MAKHYTLFLFLLVQLLYQTQNMSASFYFYSAIKQKTELFNSTYQTWSGVNPFRTLIFLNQTPAERG